MDFLCLFSFLFVFLFRVSGISRDSRHKRRLTGGRRNIHQKLDITSQAELLALFVQCIPLADPDTGADPLVVFQSRPAATRLAFTPAVPGAQGAT